MPPLHVDDDWSSLDAHPIRRSVRPLHIFFVLVLDEGISSAFGFVLLASAAAVGLLLSNEPQILHRAECLHLSEQLSLRYLVRQASNEERVVAVHPLVFSATLLLFGSVGLHLRLLLLLVLFGQLLQPGLLHGLWCRADLAGWRRCPLELDHILSHAGETILYLGHVTSGIAVAARRLRGPVLLFGLYRALIHPLLLLRLARVDVLLRAPSAWVG